MLRALRCSASPGRGGHAAAMRAAETAFACRQEAAALFHMEDPEQVVFTMNATHGLNIAIADTVTPGMTVLVSGYEHNAVMRPLCALGAKIVEAPTPLFDAKAALAFFREHISQAGAVICTHVSNVFGFVLPVEEIAALCRREGVPFILDAAQSAGALDIDFSALGAAFAAMPGHKGLLGPQGTGLLLCRDVPRPLLYGGTGSRSAERDMPPFLPDRLEAGTQNLCGIAGLLEGLRFVRKRGRRVFARGRTRCCGG
jgi:selenocysteine lyase/cysteine desulfurase